MELQVAYHMALSTHGYTKDIAKNTLAIVICLRVIKTQPEFSLAMPLFNVRTVFDAITQKSSTVYFSD